MNLSVSMTIHCGQCDRHAHLAIPIVDWDTFTVQGAFVEATDHFQKKGWAKTTDNAWECPWHGDAARRAA